MNDNLFHFKAPFFVLVASVHNVPTSKWSLWLQRDHCARIAGSAAVTSWSTHTGKHVRIGYKYNIFSCVCRSNIYPTWFKTHNQFAIPSFNFTPRCPRAHSASQTYLNDRRFRHIRGTEKRRELPAEPSRLRFARHCQPHHAASHSLAPLH